MATTSNRRPRRNTTEKRANRSFQELEYFPGLPLEQIPDWSEATAQALGQLSPLEASFVQWMGTGLTATSAFIKAAGSKANEVKYAKQYAYALRRRPRVQTAIELILKDRNFAARFDREWKLQQLGSLVMQYENDGSPAALRKIPGLIRLMAALQGYLLPQSAPPVSPTPRVQTSITVVVQDILESVKQSRAYDGFDDPMLSVESESAIPMASPASSETSSANHRKLQLGHSSKMFSQTIWLTKLICHLLHRLGGQLTGPERGLPTRK